MARSTTQNVQERGEPAEVALTDTGDLGGADLWRREAREKGGPRRIVIVSSVGGHLTEIMRLAPLLATHEVVLVINDAVELPDFAFARVYRIAHAERDWRVLLNFAEAARILREERPDVLVSAGAGPVVPFAIVAHLLGARVVYIESAAAVTRPTLTGRLMYPLADDFFYQWPGLARTFPRGRHLPLLFG